MRPWSKTRRHRTSLLVAAALAVAAVVSVATTGCGGGGSETMSRAEVITQLNAGCDRLSGTVVWLPEHLEKTDKSLTEGEAIVRSAEAENRELLQALDPPADLEAPLKRLVAFQFDPEIKSRSAFVARQERLVGLYREIGAERCRQGAEASILTVKGMAVEDAYHRVGAQLPPHPPGW